MKTPHAIFLNFVALIVLAVFFSGCEKPEGEGGNGRITGKIWAEQWNATFTLKQAEHAAMDEWVYIIYGDNISYGDRIRTNFNGEYEFKYLREGTYKIYVYSEDKTLQSPSGQVAIVKQVTVSDDKTTTVDLITIYK